MQRCSVGPAAGEDGLDGRAVLAARRSGVDSSPELLRGGRAVRAGLGPEFAQARRAGKGGRGGARVTRKKGELLEFRCTCFDVL